MTPSLRLSCPARHAYVPRIREGGHTSPPITGSGFGPTCLRVLSTGSNACLGSTPSGKEHVSGKAAKPHELLARCRLNSRVQAGSVTNLPSSCPVDISNVTILIFSLINSNTKRAKRKCLRARNTNPAMHAMRSNHVSGKATTPHSQLPDRDLAQHHKRWKVHKRRPGLISLLGSEPICPVWIMRRPPALAQDLDVRFSSTSLQRRRDDRRLDGDAERYA